MVKSGQGMGGTWGEIRPKLTNVISKASMLYRLMLEPCEANRTLTVYILMFALAKSICRYTQVTVDASLLTQCITALQNPSAVNQRWLYFLILSKIGIISLQYGLQKWRQPVEEKFVASMAKMRHLKLIKAFCDLEFSEKIKVDIQRGFSTASAQSNDVFSSFMAIVDSVLRIGEICLALVSLSWGFTNLSPRLMLFSTTLVVAYITTFIYFLYFAGGDQVGRYPRNYKSRKQRKASAVRHFVFGGEDEARDLTIHGAARWVLKTYEKNAEVFSYSWGRPTSKSELVLGVLQLFEVIGIPMFAIASGNTIHVHAYNLAQKKLSAICSNLTSLERALDMTQRRIIPYSQNYFRYLSMPKKNDSAKYTISESVNSIELSNVSYSYGGNPTEKLALRDFSFRFESGKIYSVVGLNGSGKSTLVSLLTKLLSPLEEK